MVPTWVAWVAGIGGLIAGMAIGVVTAAMCSASKMANDHWDELDEKKRLDEPDENR